MVKILNFKNGATVIQLNATATNLNVWGYFNVPLQER
jgi:hypothetical protein